MLTQELYRVSWSSGQQAYTFIVYTRVYILKFKLGLRHSIHTHFLKPFNKSQYGNFLCAIPQVSAQQQQKKRHSVKSNTKNNYNMKAIGKWFLSRVLYLTHWSCLTLIMSHGHAALLFFSKHNFFCLVIKKRLNIILQLTQLKQLQTHD